MCRPYTGEAARERRHAERSGVVGEVAGNLLGRCGKVPAPSQEMSQITLVCTLGVFCSCGSDEFKNFGISAAQG
jgi:hypothetical protein